VALNSLNPYYITRRTSQFHHFRVLQPRITGLFIIYLRGYRNRPGSLCTGYFPSPPPRYIGRSIFYQTTYMYLSTLGRLLVCYHPSCLDIRLGPVHEGLQLEQLDGQIDIVLQIVLRVEVEFRRVTLVPLNIQPDRGAAAACSG